jgi:hypothetical protein
VTTIDILSYDSPSQIGEIEKMKYQKFKKAFFTNIVQTAAILQLPLHVANAVTIKILPVLY